MFRRRRSNPRRNRPHYIQRGYFDFMRRPAFQIGLVIVALILIISIALIGQGSSSPKSNVNITGNVTPKLNPDIISAGTSIPAEISIQAANKLYVTGAAYILDVRERSEWNAFHIPNTTLLPIGQVSALANKFPKDKPIIVVCSSNECSQQARDILKQAGYDNVSSLNGTVAEWKALGYPIQP